MNKRLSKNFKFHSNLNTPKNTVSYFPCFYKDILKLWSRYYSNQPSVRSNIASQCLWFNICIKIENKVVFYRNFSENINFVNVLIKENRKFKIWQQITYEFKTDKNLYFKWISTSTCNNKQTGNSTNRKNLISTIIL